MTVDEVRDALRAPLSLDLDTRTDLEAALDRIPRRYKHLLVMHHMVGYSQREAMRAVGSRSWQDWKRAERALMKELNDGA